MNSKQVFCIYLILINLYGFVIMYLDKKRAIKHRYRISEKQLWLVTCLFGGLGTTLGMHTFHHKNKKPLFFIGFPILCILEMIVICAIMVN